MTVKAEQPIEIKKELKEEVRVMAVKARQQRRDHKDAEQEGVRGAEGGGQCRAVL